MAIKLQDMLKKAETKGYSTSKVESQKIEINKPWQQNSVLFTQNQEDFNKNDKEENVHKNAHKLNTNDTQTVHKNTNDTQTVHKNNNKSYTESYTNYSGKSDSSKYKKLKGLQKNILYFIYENCKKNRSLVSDVITKEEIAESLNIKYLSIHNTIQRLIEKGFLIRNTPIYGRAGATIYELPDFIYTQISEFEIEYSKQDKSYTNLNTKNNSSSIYNYKNTTTNLPEEWKNINFIPLEHIGFTKTQLLQLYETNSCIPEGVQESINYLAFDLENNNLTNKYSDPLNVFMGTLRKGKLWSKPKDYKSPQEIAMENLLTKKKEERERIKQLKDESYKLALEEWQESLSQEQLEEIAPAKKGKGDLMPQSVKLSMYFRENIWPKKKGEYLPN